jgi:hypothetical protein
LLKVNYITFTILGRFKGTYSTDKKRGHLVQEPVANNWCSGLLCRRYCVLLLEHRRNEDILKELNIDPVVCYIQQYRTRWEKKNMLRGWTPTDCLNRFYHMPQEVAEVWGDPKSAGKRP